MSDDNKYENAPENINENGNIDTTQTSSIENQDSEIEKTESKPTDSQNEQINLITQKPNNNTNDNPYDNYNNHPQNFSVEDNYNRFTVKEENSRNNSYRWNFNEEEQKNSKKSKNKHKATGLRIFAAAMSVMFMLTTFSTAALLINKLNPPVDANVSNDIPIITNSIEPKKSDEIMKDTSIVLPNANTTSSVLTTQEVIAKVKPSVVCIEVSVQVENSFFGRSYTETGVGTGFILTEDGYIATNYHVVDGAQSIKVTLMDGTQYDAEVRGGDEAADLAVIKINAKDLPVAPLGDSDVLIQGDDVVAIGTPAGAEFAGTTTKGIISAINRNVEVGVDINNKAKTMTVIQTDTSINPGNSGGPLVNNKGQVIGINTMKLASSLYEGMGFAIPINAAIPTINDLIANPGIKKDPSVGSDSENIEDKSNVSFGITGGTISEEEAQYTNIPHGFKISDIIKDGPCYNVGIVVGDIIVALDDEPVTSFNDLATLKSNYKPGDKAKVTIYRNGDNFDFEITFAAKS